MSYRDMEGQQKRLGDAMNNLRHHQTRLGEAMAMQGQVRQQRAAMRGQLMDAVALGAALQAPIRAAMNLESAEVRLRTVISADDVGAAMRDARRHALQWGRNNPTSAADMLGIQYALSSAGFDAAAARFGSEIVAKVATATDGQAEQVGELIGVVYNNLGRAMEGGMEQRLARIGDVLTQAQLDFQIRDFGQLGESFREGASAAIRYNISLEQTAAILGQFNSAGLMGSRAGTAMNAMLRQMGKAAEEFGFHIERNRDGSMDLMATLENLQYALDIFDDPDEKARALQEAFGDQGAQVALLLNDLEGLQRAYDKLATAAEGATERAYQTRINSTAAQLQILRNRTTEAAAALGSVLLPGVNAVGGALGQAATSLTELAERFPVATKWVVGLTAGMIAGRVAAIALGYGWTFVRGALVGGVVALRTAQAAVALATVQMHAFSAASLLAAARLKAVATLGMVFNPVTAVIAALAAAAFLVVRHWEPVKSFFSGLWSGIKAGLEPLHAGFESIGAAVRTAIVPLAPLFEPLGAALGWVGEQIGAAIGWVRGLLGPVDASAEALGRASSAGEAVGQVLGTVVAAAALAVVAPIRAVGEAVGWVAGRLGGARELFETAFAWSPLGLLMNGFEAARGYLDGIDWSESGRAILGTLAEGIKSVAGAPLEAVRGVLGKARELLPFSDAKTGPLSDLTASGAAIPRTIGEGVSLGGDALGHSLRETLGRAWGSAREWLGGDETVTARVRQVLEPAQAAALAGAGALAVGAGGGEPARSVEIHNRYEITVQAPAGADLHELAALVRRELDERDREMARRNRGALFDEVS
ncbi:phage tail tape measure protein [Thioalkalivibrio sulfidiphilus]|uniref:phage tail tape measure protein n=1 Tax=Thioalkalivibrio sulfidiphilus TaxID=1033854 RepID=UPI003B2E62D2